MSKVKIQNTSSVFGLSALMLFISATSPAGAQLSLTKNYGPEDAPNCHDVFNGMSYTTGDKIVCPERIEGAVDYINNTGAFGVVEHIGHGLLCQKDGVEIEGQNTTQIELSHPFMIALAGLDFYIVTPEIEPSFTEAQDLQIEHVAQEYIMRNRLNYGLACRAYLGS